MNTTVQCPLVSVIIPNYNYARYLRERIDSILNQTFQDFEIIILDDVSTDESLHIINEYSTHHKVYRIEINETNSGTPFIQWRKGIQMARGKYVWIAEADDVAEPKFLETTVQLMEKYTEASVCHVGFQVIDSQSQPQEKDHNKWGAKREAKGHACFDGAKYVQQNLYWCNCIYNASGVLFNREKAVNASNSIFTTMRNCGDWLFWVDMALSGKVIEVYEVLNKFRRHETSVTYSGNQHGRARIIKEEIEIIKSIHKNSDGISSYKKQIRGAGFYKKIKRSKFEPSLEKELFHFLKEELGITSRHYALERINKYICFILPFLFLLMPNKNRDRL